MRLEVLGSAGAEFPGFNPPAFLIDGSLLLDAGTIGSRLNESGQRAIRDILITHAHLDHVRGIPFLADNIITNRTPYRVNVYGIGETLSAIRDNLLNDRIWPDFTKLPSVRNSVIRLRRVTEDRPFSISEYRIKARRVYHTVPAVGYEVEDKAGKKLLYTGDTGPADTVWEKAGRLHALIIEVSFPNSMERLAIKTGHLTARLLKAELEKLRVMPDRILVTHPKPQYINRIKDELKNIGNGRIELLRDGSAYEI